MADDVLKPLSPPDCNRGPSHTTGNSNTKQNIKNGNLPSPAEPLSPVVADTVKVGTKSIFESNHVSQGPGRLATAPVPSVFSDDRGEIHRLRVGHQRINLLYSKKSVMRSGYLHSHDMHDFVISGRVEVWVLADTGTTKSIYGENEYFIIRPYVPHILHFLEDTIIAEWWGKGQFQCWYYHPYRRIIDVQNTLVSKSMGTFQHLVPIDQRKIQQGSNRNSSIGSKLLCFTSGIVVGTIFGGIMVAGMRRRS